MAVGPDGNIYVASSSPPAVLRFDGSTGRFLGVFADVSSAGDEDVRTGTVRFHDGNLYVTTGNNDSVLRFDGQTGDPLPALGKVGAEFVTVGDGGLEGAWGMDFGPDGKLYVTSALTHQVLTYDGSSGNFAGVFVPAADHGLSTPVCLAFGPDGNLYVGSSTNQVLRYQGPSTSSPGAFMDYFVTAGSGGLAFPPAAGLAFGPAGDLYVSSRDTDSVLRFDGTSGSFVEAVVPAGSGGLDGPKGIVFDSNGFLLVSSATDEILRYGSTSHAVFHVTLAQPVPFELTVDYSTANRTALAGSDYVATSGTLILPAGQTTKSIVVPTWDDSTLESPETFVVDVSNLTRGVIQDGQGVGTILDDDTKFYVVNDAAPDKTFEYGGDGTSGESYNLGSGNTAPRGAVSTAAGDRVWVVDASKQVYVYDADGGLLGSWSLGSMNPKADVQGIATSGTDVWVVDANADKVLRYAGAANRLDGSQNAASSFALNTKRGNKGATDIVTDGASLWVLDNSTVDKVFKYTVAGALVGSWTITTSGATSPTGITIDPANVSNIWIVDSGTRRVYQYNDAASLPDGSSKSADASFALAAGNTNPQGIADPPVAAVFPLSQPTLIPLATRTQVATDAVLRGMMWLPWDDEVMLRTADRSAVSVADSRADVRFPTSEIACQDAQVQPAPAATPVERVQLLGSTNTHQLRIRDELLAIWNAEGTEWVQSGLVDGM